MAYATPTIPIPPNPIFIDASIAEIQTSIGAITWLTHAFGRAYPKEEMRSGFLTKQPFVYKGSAEYLPVQFNDNLQGQSFFEVGSQTIVDNFDPFTINFYTVNIGLIFWADLKKIDGVKGANYYFAEQLKKDVRDVLRNMMLTNGRLKIQSIDENIDEIFKEYTFEQIDRQYFSYPYVAFKFNLELTIGEEC